ncbi:hypothetical protein U0070_008234 [Myodes glareolus]|uniref:Small ribosomal subunit protein uS17 N-terminal domain-containing protein n=1 Tax=Myodes glareolus TaxID=447135 RepID=A0AAW0I948_MYOGA
MDKEKLPWYYKNIDLGFKTPKEAIEGTYIDKKYPFTGNVIIRGRILSIVMTKMKISTTLSLCRPLSKTVRFNVRKVTKAAGTKKQFQKF